MAVCGVGWCSRVSKNWRDLVCECVLTPTHTLVQPRAQDKAREGRTHRGRQVEEEEEVVEGSQRGAEVKPLHVVALPVPVFFFVRVS
jgi:hypothetical protein